MNDKRYKWILYTIITVIVATIVIQVYWNYKNYETNKQQLINDMQVSLDKAVDDYYADLAEKTTIGFSLSGDQQNDPLKEGSELSNILEQIDEENNVFTNLDSLNITQIEGIKVLRGRAVDSMNSIDRRKNPPISIDSFKAKMKALKAENNAVDLSSIKMLTSKIVVSIKNDTLDLNKVSNLVFKELNRKNINLKHKLIYYDDKTIPNKALNQRIDSSLVNDTKLVSEDEFTLSTTSKSTFLPKGKTLELKFTNETQNILKRILGGILISTLLVLAVISCLFYLLKIIKHQKQLAEVKNDLISNITHEFKTPIATIGVALESISNFNAIEDKERTKKYLKMSTQQLTKLNIMVEKLLETATLDSDNLELNREQIDVIELLKSLTLKYKMQFPNKTFNTSFKVEKLLTSVDIFHFENALNNMLDNALKYGGNIISIDLRPKEKSFELLISDNGSTLTKTNKERVFEKFYRVPKGNTHDVKGFGIGLYYTKTIIDKHNGNITLDLNKNLTTFKITLPYG